MQETIFDKIIRDEVPNWKVWENTDFLAFLTPFPSTLGMTLVIPKKNPGDYVFDLESELYLGLMSAAKEVAKVLEKIFETKIALVFEGTGVPYVHAKLYPMHNVFNFDESKAPTDPIFYKEYPGFIDTHSGPLMESAVLDELQKRIRSIS